MKPNPMHQKTNPSFQMSIYKARKARAAAPIIPAAWVAWAAAPVNCEAVGAVAEGAVPLPLGVGTAETEETGAADEAAASDVGAALEAAADVTGAALVGSGAAEVGAAEDAPGTSMGTPAALQVSSVAAIVAAWSEAEHAFCTQGMTAAKRDVALLQWHAKSSSEEQPSLDSGVRKQFKAQDGMFSS